LRFANPDLQDYFSSHYHRGDKEALMRISVSTLLAIGTILAAVPVQAQTYDPHYPVCMKVYGAGHDGGGEWNDCSFISLAQCGASASGRAAMCVVNPYFTQADTRRLRRVHWRDRWAY
jgi:Protein of unknown function (DUF3551)